MVAFALGSGACSSSSGSGAIGTPPGIVVFTGTVPSDLPATCTDGDYFVVSGDHGSCTGTYYLLCDGTTWNDYSCTNPSGTSGWSSYSPTGDASTPDTGNNTADTGADGASADNGTSTGDAGGGDAGSEDAGSGSGSSESDSGSPDAGSGS